MKQQSPLRKKQNYVETEKRFSAIHAYINKPTPEQVDAKRRELDEWDEGVEDLSHQPAKVEIAKAERKIMQGVVGGVGLGCAVLAAAFMYSGNEEAFVMWTAGVVVCLLGYLWLDGE